MGDRLKELPQQSGARRDLVIVVVVEQRVVYSIYYMDTLVLPYMGEEKAACEGW